MSGADDLITDGPGGPDDDRALAGEYVLGLLTPDEARAFEARLGVEPALRDLTALWTEDLASLADAIPPVTPPAGAEAALMRRLFPEPEPEAAAPRGFLGRLGLPALFGGLAAAALVVVVGVTLLRGPGAPDLVAEIAAEDRSLVVRAAYDEGAGVLSLEREAGAVPEGRDQELWLIAGEAPPVSLGLLPDEGPSELVVPPDLRPGLAGGILAISDEATGGSTTGSPGTVLAIGDVTDT